MRHTIFPVSYYKGQVEDNERLKQDLLPFINSTKNTLTPPEGWLTTKITTSLKETTSSSLCLKQNYRDSIII